MNGCCDLRVWQFNEVSLTNCARGSLLELETQVLIAQDLGYAPPAEVSGLMRSPAEIGSMLNALIQSIRPRASHVARQ